MRHSQVIEVSGQFAGLALDHGADRLRFKAVDLRVEELDDSLWSTVEQLRRAVAHLLTTGRLPAAA